MEVRIFKPSRSTMQSALGKTKEWVLEVDQATARRPEPVMGWVASGDTTSQIRISFEDKQAAIAFAERKGWAYTVQEPAVRRVRPRSNLDNFRPGRVV